MLFKKERKWREERRQLCRSSCISIPPSLNTRKDPEFKLLLNGRIVFQEGRYGHQNGRGFDEGDSRDVEQDRWPSSSQDWQQWRLLLVHVVWWEGQGSLVKTHLPVWHLLCTYHEACTHLGCLLSEYLIWQDWMEVPRKGTEPPCNEAGKALALPM